MNLRILVGRKLTAPGILLVFAIPLGTLLTGCGSGVEVAESNPPSTPEEADNLVVRVSGTEVAAESTTYVESGSVIVDWLPQLGATGEEILLQEGLPEEENQPKEEKK